MVYQTKLLFLLVSRFGITMLYIGLVCVCMCVCVVMKLLQLAYNMQVVVTCTYYPVYVCAAGLCIWSHRFVYVYMCVYMFAAKKNCLFEVLPLENFLLVTYCSLVNFNRQKSCSLHQVICSGKEIRRHSIIGTGNSQGFWNLYLW